MPRRRRRPQDRTEADPCDRREQIERRERPDDCLDEQAPDRSRERRPRSRGVRVAEMMRDVGEAEDVQGKVVEAWVEGDDRAATEHERESLQLAARSAVAELIRDDVEALL